MLDDPALRSPCDDDGSGGKEDDADVAFAARIAENIRIERDDDEACHWNAFELLESACRWVASTAAVKVRQSLLVVRVHAAAAHHPPIPTTVTGAASRRRHRNAAAAAG